MRFRTYLFAAVTALLVSSGAQATTMSYDLGGASGSIGNYSYTEIHLGLNWFVLDWLNWRNAIFSRFGSDIDTVSGLDSSLLATFSAMTDGGGLGFEVFAGPGVRFATHNNNALTAQAGAVLRLGGLQLGGGVEALSYSNDRKDASGAPYAKNETQYFLILGGGGSF